MYLDHGHINGMCNGLTEAGASLKYVYDTDRARAEAFAAKYPGAVVADREETVLNDPSVKLVAAAAYYLEAVRGWSAVYGRRQGLLYGQGPFYYHGAAGAGRGKGEGDRKKYMVYYSERLHVESAVYAGNLIKQGAIGRVLNVMGLGPHRIGSGESAGLVF